MPRIYTSANNPLDFCLDCFPTEIEAREEFGNVGEGPDDRGDCFAHEAGHPPYKGEGYDCAGCGTRLTEKDD